MAQADAELNSLDDLRQPVLAIELAPFALRCDHQPERHGEAGLAAQTSLGAFRAMTHGGECAFDRVWGPDVLPMDLHRFRSGQVFMLCGPLFEGHGGFPAEG